MCWFWRLFHALSLQMNYSFLVFYLFDLSKQRGREKKKKRGQWVVERESELWWPSYSVLLSRAYHVEPDRQFSIAKSPRYIEILFLSKIQIGGPHSFLLFFSSPFFHFTLFHFGFLFSFIFLIALWVVQIWSAFLFRKGGGKEKKRKEVLQ